jgi:hypothetical protein
MVTYDDRRKEMERERAWKPPRGLRGRTEPKRTARLTSLHALTERKQQDALDAGGQVEPQPADEPYVDQDGRRTVVGHRGPGVDDCIVTASVNGRRRRVAGTITLEEYRRIESERAAEAEPHPAPDQPFCTTPLVRGGSDRGRRCERTPAWIDPAAVDDDDEYVPPSDEALHRMQREDAIALAKVEADYRAMLADWKRDARCTHCGQRGIRARNLCGACYEYRRRHRELPPIDGEVIRLRRWREEWPTFRDD